jgi:hypothetical protein
MTTNTFTFEQRNLRGTDSNSLLRMYDSANAVLKKYASQLERTKADKAIQRIAKELQRRNIHL